jgi:hypothetical protein
MREHTGAEMDDELKRTTDSTVDVPGRVRAFRKVTEFARREAGVAFPAARRAAGHGIEAFLKKFSEEYAKERKKKR